MDARTQEPSAGSPLAPPAEGTLERWALERIAASDWADKLAPDPPPVAAAASWEPAPPARRIPAPGRPAALAHETKRTRTLSARALQDPRARARLVHTFLHHELQAFELFLWAFLAFPEEPRAFRRGLIQLALEERAHLALYRGHLETLGAAVGDFPVRDWFWERVPQCADAAAFVALVGLGLEGANLDHGARFAAAFRMAGDVRGAELLERVARDERGHVAFAVRWFPRLAGALDFERWAAALPAPLTPSLFRGSPLDRAARRAAGMDDRFLDALAAAPSTTRRSARAQG